MNITDITTEAPPEITLSDRVVRVEFEDGSTQDVDCADAGLGLALATLYEANDLLNLMREHDTDTEGALSAPYRTLTSEIHRRLNTAIAALDGAVPHPADTVATDYSSTQSDMTDFCDEIASRLNWTDGVLGMIVCDQSVEDDISNAAAGAQRHMAEAQGLLEQAMRCYRARQSGGVA